MSEHIERTFHKDGTLPVNGEVFVFGSNEAGIHGAGAARAALEKFGAQWGFGVGHQGQSFAIPTKDKIIDTLPMNTISAYVKVFVLYTKQNPDMKFFVTRIGCGLAGLKDRDMAPLFKDAINCSFAEEWRPYLEN